MLVGIFSQVSFLRTWVMMLVTTVRIRAASRTADTARGMYCIMLSMCIPSYYTFVKCFLSTAPVIAPLFSVDTTTRFPSMPRTYSFAAYTHAANLRMVP